MENGYKEKIFQMKVIKATFKKIYINLEKNNKQKTFKKKKITLNYYFSIPR